MQPELILVLLGFTLVWLVSIWAGAVIFRDAEPFIDAAGDEHYYSWPLGALMGFVFSLFGLMAAAIWVRSYTPDGKPKVAVDHDALRDPRGRV